VNEAIENNGEVDITIITSVDIQPIIRKDGYMVVNVQNRELIPLLRENDENGVEEVEDLRHIENPQYVSNRGLFIIKGGTDKTVVVSVGQQESFHAHVRAQNHLSQVIDELERVKVELQVR
jgi:hypothetical protein